MSDEKARILGTFIGVLIVIAAWVAIIWGVTKIVRYAWVGQ